MAAEKTLKLVWRSYSFAFLRGFSFFSAVLVPFFTDWGGISLTQAQLLQSWFMLWIFLLEVPTGAVADFLGRKHSLTLGAIVATLGPLIYGSFPRFEFFLIGEFLFALGWALSSGADSALLYDTLKEAGQEEKSKQIFGRVHTFHLLGIFLAAPIGGWLAGRFGLNVPMLLTAVPNLIAIFIAWGMHEPKIQDQTSESKRYLVIARQGLSYFRHHRVLRRLALDAILVASAAYFVIWLYQPLLSRLNVSVAYFGWFHALLVAVEMLIASNFEFLEKLFGSEKAYLRFSAVITSVAFLIAAAVPNLITAVAFIVLAGGFGLTRIELMSAYMNRLIPSGQRATILSSVSMFRRLALVFLNPLIGFTADNSLRLAMVTAGVLPLLVFLFSPIEQELFETNE